MSSAERSRVVEALEAALRVGQGRVNVYARRRTRSRITSHEPRATIHQPRITNHESRITDLPGASPPISTVPTATSHYHEPTPSLFSFNSPLGACDTCRGFGRIIGIDFGLVIPNESKTLREGAIKPWQTPSFSECQDDLRSTPRSTAFRWMCLGAT